MGNPEDVQFLDEVMDVVDEIEAHPAYLEFADEPFKADLQKNRAQLQILLHEAALGLGIDDDLKSQLVRYKEGLRESLQLFQSLALPEDVEGTVELLRRYLMHVEHLRSHPSWPQWEASGAPFVRSTSDMENRVRAALEGYLQPNLRHLKSQVEENREGVVYGLAAVDAALNSLNAEPLGSEGPPKPVLPN